MDARIAVWMAPRPLAEAYVQDGLPLLQANCSDVVVVHDKDELSAAEQIREMLPNLDAVVSSPWFHPQASPAFWEAGRRLQVVAGTYDFRFSGWLDASAMQKSGITVVDTSRSMTPSVAEFALAMILNLIRDIPRGIDLVRQGSWKDTPWDLTGFVHGDLTGRRVGLAGFGSINRRLTELLSPFHCQVKTYDPYVGADVCGHYGVEKVETLQTLAEQSEVFVVGVPPTPTTLQIINESVIEALPPGALFVLVTRMAVVQQEPLWQRIEQGTLRAAIDVFEPEPPPEAFWGRYHPHVLPTPHIAGGTMFCHRRCFVAACQDTIAVLSGQKPTYPVTRWDDQCYQGALDLPEGA